jgi:hypothetical protein
MSKSKWIRKRVQNDYCHAEFVSASHLSLGFDLNFELCHLNFMISNHVAL